MKKLSEKPDDLYSVLSEIEDFAADKSDVETKMDRFETADKQAPRDKDLSNGESRAVNDGTNRRIYLKIGGELWYLTATKA